MVFPGEVTSNAFPQTIVDAVLAHMNGDHPDDNVLIVRAFLEPAAEAATMIGLDGSGGEWTWTVDGTAAGGGCPGPPARSPSAARSDARSSPSTTPRAPVWAWSHARTTER